MKPRFVSFIPAIGWFIFIGILLTLPGKDIPKADFLELIHFDKWVHAGLFAVLVFLFCYPLKDTFSHRHFFFLIIMLLCTTYGIAMEYVQKDFAEGRSFDITDMMADAVGVCLGYIFFRIVLAKVSQKNKPL